MTMSKMALRWILMSPAVIGAITRAKRPSQVEENVSAADLPPLAEESMDQIREIYTRLCVRMWNIIGNTCFCHLIYTT